VSNVEFGSDAAQLNDEDDWMGGEKKHDHDELVEDIKVAV